MTNPYTERIKEMPAFGRVDAKALRHLEGISLDPEEKAVASIKCAHGQLHGGFLVLTTARLRWVQTFPTKTHDYWPLVCSLAMLRTVPPIMHILETGELFQGSGFNPKPYKEFVALQQQMAEAIGWDISHAAPAPVPVIVTGNTMSIADELDELDAMRTAGRLSDGEFAAARQKVLGA